MAPLHARLAHRAGGRWLRRPRRGGARFPLADARHGRALRLAGDRGAGQIRLRRTHARPARGEKAGAAGSNPPRPAISTTHWLYSRFWRPSEQKTELGAWTRAVQRSLLNVIASIDLSPPKAAARRSCGVVVCIVQDFGMMNRTVHESFQTQVVVFCDPVSAGRRSALRRAQYDAAFAPQFRACGPSGGTAQALRL